MVHHPWRTGSLGSLGSESRGDSFATEIHNFEGHRIICDTSGDFHGDSDADAGHSPHGLLDVWFGLSKAP